MMIATCILATALSVDFTAEIGRIRPELHSSGFGPTIDNCAPETLEDIRELGFKYARTHDWALINRNHHVCDHHHIFPLMHLDAKDPKNYVFAPTDYLLKRTREDLGCDIFFRLGPSIEHSGPNVRFNTRIPEDFDKVAETFAGTIRHYNRGWANGFKWGIKYWEIWNEPDGTDTMWSLPDGDTGKGSTKAEIAADKKARDLKRRDLFIKFFVTCLKRLKSEFPEVKVGGPALCGMRETYFRELLSACKAAGVAPDFISWHHYTGHPPLIMKAIEKGRSLCDEYGFKDCEIIINEWHFIHQGRFEALRSKDPVIRKQVWTGPGSHNGIDASCFHLTMLSKFQTSKLDQAYYYGCGHTTIWGYKDNAGKKYKTYYGLKMFNEMAKTLPVICKSTSKDTVTVFALKSDNGRRMGFLAIDYLGDSDRLEVEVKGVAEDAQTWIWAHDYERDYEMIRAPLMNGRVILKKKVPGSAAFSVWF